MGNREPISYRKYLMHFKGSLIIYEIFNYLSTKKLLASRD
jgi:hypothetical protein